ncbi:hypothetical protein B0H13DRAFT_2341666 [Mycena leptocephala]|nr:hypothetical protein B0H13DRAFT_2374956 [Mycena leptocephala]KAJ7889217.1 hypothetical protein B0H13DRAFT_2341666 [Mycena leptocephala]
MCRKATDTSSANYTPSNAIPRASLVVLASIVGFSVGQVNTTCLAPDGTTGDCSSVISTFCSSLAVDIIAPTDTLTRCFNMPDGVRCDFGVVNNGDATDAPSVVNCQLIFNQVSAECPTGGRGNVVGLPFAFQVDPNEGACAVIPPGN